MVFPNRVAPKMPLHWECCRQAPVSVTFTALGVCSGYHGCCPNQGVPSVPFTGVSYPSEADNTIQLYGRSTAGDGWPTVIP